MVIFIKQSLGIPLPTFQEKNRPEKVSLFSKNNWIILAAQKSDEEKKYKRGNYEALCFSSKRQKHYNLAGWRLFDTPDYY